MPQKCTASWPLLSWVRHSRGPSCSWAPGSTAFLPDSKCLVDDGRGRTPALKKCEVRGSVAQRGCGTSPTAGQLGPWALGQPVGRELRAVGAELKGLWGWISCSYMNPSTDVRDLLAVAVREGLGQSQRLWLPPQGLLPHTAYSSSFLEG